jgi:PAS domain S-box-containing protein
MCGWDWDMVTGADTFYGDTVAIFGTEPGATYDAFRRIVHPDDLAPLEQALADAAENRHDYDGEFRVVHPHGAVRWIHGRGKFTYEGGKAVRMVGVNVDVTEAKNREWELAEARANLQGQKTLLETIVDNIPVMLCCMREPGKVHWVNRTWENTLGWTPADNGGDFTSLLYPDPVQAAIVKEFIAEASAEWREFSPCSKGGKRIEAEFMNVALPDGTNIGMGRDVTLQKRTINELIESGRRFRLLSENIPQLVWIADAEARTRYYNQRWYEYTGQTAAQAGGYGWRQAVHPDDLESNRLIWEQAIQRGENFQNELRLRRHDGEYRWFLVRAVPVRDSRGRLERWFGTSTDITDRKLTEQRLRRSEARYRTLVEATAQMVWSSNGDGNEFGSMDDWEEFTGQTAHEARDGGWAAAIHPDDAAASLQAWNQAVSTGKLYHHEHRIRRRDGVYRLMSSRAVPIADEAGNISEWIGTQKDITDQKLAELALIRAEKLATAGRFAATVAHEVNNPLTAVTNIHYILAGDETLPESVRAYLSLADSELHRVSHILRQTLAFYREHSRTQHVKLAALVDEVAAIFRHRLQIRGIEIEIRISEDLTLSTMPGELRQMLSNLLANAFDACPKKGRILVRARARAGRVRIAVADNGSGVTPENQAHLFEPFFTTKESVGTGLGLWVTRQLAERNHGSIRVRSRAGVGTVFVLDFPVAVPAPSPIPTTSDGFNSHPWSGEPVGAGLRDPVTETPHPSHITLPVQ